MTKYYVKAEKMSVGYQGRPLIEEIEITLEKGEILTLIGPNGAGKSTILKSIARQLELIGGTVFLDGRDMVSMSGSETAKRLAVVLTEKLCTELMTCEDVVATGRYPYTGRFGILSEADHQAVEEAMELVHVTEIRNQDFTKISDGQRQRVMLARAICQEPELVILDEPTSFLDVRYKLDFLSVLQALKEKKGLTVIMSLHELELAERISDKLLCIRQGFVERFGTPEEVFQPGFLTFLFGVEAGSFDEENGTLELTAPEGTPEIFVIAGGGSGRKVFRRLQREGRAFVTGILYENDLDYPTARALAAEVVSEAAFEPVREEALALAKEKLALCSRVVCCRERFGALEAANEELLCYAQQLGKKIERRQNDGKGNNDSGHHVQCGKKPSGRGPMPDLSSGRLPGGAF